MNSHCTCVQQTCTHAWHAFVYELRANPRRRWNSLPTKLLEDEKRDTAVARCSIPLLPQMTDRQWVMSVAERTAVGQNIRVADPATARYRRGSPAACRRAERASRVEDVFSAGVVARPCAFVTWRGARPNRGSAR